MLIHEQDRVRLISRGGYYRAKRFPLIVAAPRNCARSFSCSTARSLCSTRTASPTSARCILTNTTSGRSSMPSTCSSARARISIRRRSRCAKQLAQLLSREVDDIFIAEYVQGDIGDVLFRVACNMGLEGILSKGRDRAYGLADANTGSKSRTRASGMQQGEKAISVALPQGSV